MRDWCETFGASILQWFEPGPLGEIWSFSRAHARPAHHHPETEFNVVTRGRALYRIGGRRILVQAEHEGSERTAVLVPFRSMIEHELVAASPDLDMWVVYSPPRESEGQMLGMGRALLQSSFEGPRVLAGDVLDGLLEFCRAAHAHRSREGMAALYDHTARSYALAAAPDVESSQRFVQQALALLEDDPTLSRAQLAHQIERSAAELSRMAHRHLGVPLVRHRNRLRLGRLLDLAQSRRVKKTSTSLLSLALEAGFGSSAGFHRVFAQELGQSPVEYLSGGVKRLTSQVKPLTELTLGATSRRPLREGPWGTAFATHEPAGAPNETSDQ